MVNCTCIQNSGLSTQDFQYNYMAVCCDLPITIFVYTTEKPQHFDHNAVHCVSDWDIQSKYAAHWSCLDAYNFWEMQQK